MWVVQVVENPTQPARQKTGPPSTKHPRKPTPNTTKPPADPTPKSSTPKPSQLSKNERNPVCSSESTLFLLLILFHKATPAVVPEQREQKPTPANPRPVKSQTTQDPAASTNAFQQPRTSRTKAQASNLDGPVPPRVKNPNNSPTPATTRPQTVVSCSMAITAITQDNKGLTPSQHGSPSSSTSGTSSRKNNRRNKKVCYICNLSYSAVLTGYNTNRSQSRRIQQPKQDLHRKAHRRNRVRSRNRLLCNRTW